MSDTVAIRERILDELDADRVHGIDVTRRSGETIYAVASASTSMDRVDDAPDMDVPILVLRTIVVDLDAEAVTISDNGMWLPRDEDVTSDLTSILARTTTDVQGGTDPDDPALTKSSVEDVDVDLLLDREVRVPEEDARSQHVDKMRNHGGIAASRPWGYGAGAPPEIDGVLDRLAEAGLDPSEHTTRLVWGKKEPMDRVPRDPDELTGNYGIELLPRDSGLVAIDVDYPEAFPEAFRESLPETFEVSSPHGDDSRRHIVFRCDDKEAIAERAGAWAIQAADWGDLWIGDRYLVGPGSQLSEFGCDDGDHTRGERGGCEACEDPERGRYRIVNDAPIATIDAEDVLDLLDATDGYEARNGPADPDPPQSDEDDARDARTCDACGATYPEGEADDALKTTTLGGSERRFCRGGC